MSKTIGLLVMAYGTPYKESDIEPYYTDIRHGKKPTDEELQDLKNRYEFIGGLSPLAGNTDRQAGKKKKKKKKNNDGITEAVTVVLAPHYSSFSVGSYDERADQEAEKYGIQLHHVKHYYHQPKFLEFWTNQINDTLKQIPSEEHDDTVLVVSAHSLPKGLIERNNDPYPKELHDTAEQLKVKSNIIHVAEGWQSEGNTGTPWLGPDVQDLTRDLYDAHGYKNFIYTPVGFVCEHLEVLYDNDYECKVVCDDIGANYYRPDMPNTHPLFIGAIVDEIKSVF